MKAIVYLRRLDNIRLVFDEVQRSAVITNAIKWYFIGQLEGVKEMALEDMEISANDFDEILETKMEYVRLLEVKDESEGI